LAPLTADQAVRVGGAARSVGTRATGRRAPRVDHGHAVIEAVDRGAQLATVDVAVMSGLLPDGWPVIRL
jgi:hypothetical protein